MSAEIIFTIILVTVLILIIGFENYFKNIIKKGKNRVVLLRKKQIMSSFQALANRKEASYHLQQKLIDMVGGNPTEAEKLVTRVRFGRPGKSESYYWWKAIQELEHKHQQDSNEQK